MTAKQKWVLTLAAVATCMTALDTLVVATALNTIQDDLGASVESLEWTLNAYNLSLAVLLMPAAALGDRRGRRLLFAAGIGVFVVASAACALAPSVGVLIAARALQGVGAAAMTTLGLTLVSEAFPPERRGSALGVFFAVNGLAIAGGPLVGGAVTEGIAWEWIFWINAPIGLLLIPLLLAKVSESRGPKSPLDLPGIALVTAGMFGLVWALVRGNPVGWGSAEVLATMIAGVVLIACFVLWEQRSCRAMLPMRFFKLRAFSAGNGAIFCAAGSLYCGVFFIAQFQQAGLGQGPLSAGLRLMPWTGTLFFVAPVAGALVDRLGERPFLIAGPLLQAVGMGWIALIADPSMAYAELIPPLVIAGAGMSMTLPAAQGSVVSSVPPEALGAASGTNNTLRQLGGVLGIALGVAAFAGVGSYASSADFTDGFEAAMAVASGISFLGALAGATSARRTPVSAPATELSETR